MTYEQTKRKLVDEYVDRLNQTGEKDFTDLLEQVPEKEREDLASLLNTTLVLSANPQVL